MRMVRAAKVASIAFAWFGLAQFVSAADLAFQRLSLQEYEDGPAADPSYEYLPGEAVWFSARMSGFERAVVDREEETERARLTWQLRAEDPSGTLIVPPMRGLIEETLRQQEDKDWVPKFVAKLQVPLYAVRGDYRILVTAHDDISKRDATGEIRFHVGGGAAPAKDAPLGMRDFGFLANEDARFALQPAVYKLGSPLFARFEIVGFGYEGNNHFSVEYGIVIEGPPNTEGVSKKLLEEQVAAAESGESFYAQRWVPAGFRLNLDPDGAPGEHTLIITIRDKILGKTSVVRHTFQIRQ